MRHLETYLFIPLVVLLCCISCAKNEVEPVSDVTLTAEEQLMVDRLDELAVAVASDALSIEDSELGWLDQFAHTTVLGLGEATHGTKEFFEMKDRIFRYMVQNHDYQVFGIEADFAESFYINQYVQGGPGDLKEIMSERMHFWTWNTQEVAAMIEWMRDYNLSHLDEPPVLYMGYDCQYMTYQLTLLRSYLLPEAPELYARIENALKPILAADDANFSSTDQSQHDVWQDSLTLLQSAMEAHAELLVNNSNEFSFAMHKHLLRSVAQVLQSKFYSNQSDNAINWRDQYMAENMAWFMDLMGPGSKACSWAHNAHVARSGVYGGSGAMGHHLNAQYANQYQVIGFGFSRGRFTAFTKRGNTFLGLRTQTLDDNPRAVSTNHLFDQAEMPQYAISFTELESNFEWYEYFKEDRLFLQIGASYDGIPKNYYRRIDIDNEYDFMIYYKETSAAVQQR